MEAISTTRGQVVLTPDLQRRLGRVYALLLRLPETPEAGGEESDDGRDDFNDSGASDFDA